MIKFAFRSVLHGTDLVWKMGNVETVHVLVQMHR